jgi:hypothetical protein
MTFRELLAKYKDGTLSEEEKLLVEQELEKSEAINDYLAEEIEKSLLLGTVGQVDVTNEQFNIEKSIKRTVYKRLAVVVAISVICVFAINLMIQYIISPLVSSQYYDPTRKTAGQKYSQDFFYDIRAITEVSKPGYVVTGMAHVEELGFGKYNIIYERKNLFTKENETVRAQLNKNMRVGYDESLYVSRGNFAFTEFWNSKEGSSVYETTLDMLKLNTETQIAHISELPATSYISAWVRFTDDLTMEELCKLKFFTFNNINFKWIAVRTAKIQGQQLMGFYTGPNDSVVSSDKIDQDKYPGFELVDFMFSPIDTPYEAYMAKNYETHYISLLKYLVDHQDAATALVGNAKQFDYKGALEYAENSGISTYGALVFGEAEELLELYDSGNIMTLTIDNVIASQYIQ